ASAWRTASSGAAPAENWRATSTPRPAEAAPRNPDAALRLCVGEFDPGEDLDDRAVVFPREAGRAGLHEHLVRGGRERQRKLAAPGHVQHQAQVLDEDI